MALLVRRLLFRRPQRFLRPSPLLQASSPCGIGGLPSHPRPPSLLTPQSTSRFLFSSRPSQNDEPQNPAATDHRSLLSEDDFHRLADATIHDLLEKLEEYGDSVQLDGFDIDYGNQVLTLRLGELGTYVVNKQTPNRQIWLSSPVSGPARFDWHETGWVYRRTKVKLSQLLEDELQKLCGKHITLS